MTDQTEETSVDSEWSNRFGDEQIDWPRAMVDLANIVASDSLVSSQSPLYDSLEQQAEECLGFAVQVYEPKDLNRLIDELPHVRLRVGAQVLCDKEMLRRGGMIDI